MLAPGQRIDRWELVQPIGDGGMAHVWAARPAGVDPAAAGMVALKIIHSRFAENAAFRAMFLEEARLVTAIDHPNIARVYDLGGNADLLYLVMEYVDGDSLFGLISPERTVPLPVALRIIAETAAGLDVVHRMVDARGQPLHVVHRDVSPQNILLDYSGGVKLIDFGIAHARDRVVATTNVGQVKGKLRYMAPEQARQEAVGAFTDVFACGAVLHRMLAGRAPYAEANDILTMQALLANKPPSTPLPRDVPPQVVQVIGRALAVDPRARFATALEFKHAVESALAAFPPVDLGGWVRTAVANNGGPRRPRVPAIAEPPGVTVRPATPARPPAATAPDLPEPAFMDVRALVAEARQPPRHGGTAPMPGRPQPADGRGAGSPGHGGGPPPNFDPGGGSAEAAPAAPPKPRATGVGEAGARTFRLAVATVVFVGAIVLLLLLLPRFVRDRAITTAREAGFILAVEHVSVGASGITLRGLQLTAVSAPGLTAKIDEVFLAGVSGKSVKVTGLDARFDGSLTDFAVPLAMLLQEDRGRFAGTAESPRHLTLENGHVLWTGFSGAGTQIEIKGISLEGDSRGPGQEDGHGTTGPLTIQTAQQHFGPWSTSFEASPTTTRLRVSFDPPVPDGPTLLVVGGGNTAYALTVHIPRSPFQNLGLKPAELGLPTDISNDVEVQLDGKLPSSVERSEIKGTITLYGAKPAGAPRPIDIRTDLVLGGTWGKPLDLDKTVVTIAPFSAAVSGTVAPTDLTVGLGVRVDASFRTLPMTCDRLAKTALKATIPDNSPAGSLLALAQSTGAFRLSGNVNASGVVKYDSATPDDTSLTWMARETCGVSIFGM